MWRARCKEDVSEGPSNESWKAGLHVVVYGEEKNFLVEAAVKLFLSSAAVAVATATRYHCRIHSIRLWIQPRIQRSATGKFVSFSDARTDW